MFDKYYMFSEEIDTKLMEFGFKLTRDGYGLQYENICKEDDITVLYEVSKDIVSAQGLFDGYGSRRYVECLEDLTFDEIINKLECCLEDLISVCRVNKLD